MLIDDKERFEIIFFFNFFVEEEFLDIRGYYIYKVIEYDDLYQFIESMKFFFKEYTR